LLIVDASSTDIDEGKCV